MAITATRLWAGGTSWASPGTTVVSASVTPGSGATTPYRLIALVASTDDASLGSDQHPGTLASSGSGPSWTSQADGANAGAFTASGSVWRSAEVTGDPGSFTVTWTRAGADNAGVRVMAIYKIEGYDSTTPTAGPKVDQTTAGNGVYAGTLGATPASGDVALVLSFTDEDQASANTTHPYSDTNRTWTGDYGGTEVDTNNPWGTAQSTGSTSTAIDITDLNSQTANDYTSVVCSIIVKVGSTGTTGTIASTLDNTTASISGTPVATGTIAATLAATTAAIAGTPVVTGTIAATLADATAEFTGGGLTGTIAATLADVIAAISGTPVITASVAATLDPATSAMSGTPVATGSIASTLANTTAAISGTPVITATIAATLADTTASISGTTTLIETFNQADSTTLGPVLTWTELSGNLQTVSNAAKSVSTGNSSARAEHDCGSADMYTEATISAWSSGTGWAVPGVAVRYQSATDSGVVFNMASDSGNWDITVRTNGTWGTTIASGSHGSPSVPFTMKLQVIGNTYTAFLNGTALGSGTDSTYTTGQRGGITTGIGGTGAASFDTVAIGVAPIITGTIAATLANTTAAIAGTPIVTATIAATLADATALFDGSTLTGTIAATLDNATAAIAGTPVVTGTIAATLDGVTANISGSVALTAAVIGRIEVGLFRGRIADDEPATKNLGRIVLTNTGGTMQQRYVVNDIGTFTYYNQDTTGALADATALTCTITPPYGAATTYTYGTDAQLVRSATGTYYVLVTLNLRGTWKVSFASTTGALTDTTIRTAPVYAV